MGETVYPDDIVVANITFRNDYNVTVNTSWRIALRGAAGGTWQYGSWVNDTALAGATREVVPQKLVGQYQPGDLLDILVQEQSLGIVWGPSDMNPLWQVGGEDYFVIGEEGPVGEILIISIIPGVA